MSIKNLLELNSSELTEFFQSFDVVLCDCDGVLWLEHVPILGVKETLSTLKACGKRVYFVSNNCSGGTKHVLNGLHKIDENLQEHDVVIPTQAIISFLKEINFDKKLFVLGTNAMKKNLIDAGFALTNTEDIDFMELMSIYKHGNKHDEDIGACILDFDYELSYKKLLEFMIYLNDEEVLFIVGATDKALPLSSKKFLIGPWYFENMLQERTNRTSMRFGKPSSNLHKFISKKYNIENPSRVLFIGDSLDQDIQFGINCGYQTLLVLTGVTKLQDLERLSSDEMPGYYINGFADLDLLIKNNLIVTNGAT
ncbi:hypothetical protein RN001_003940 [Aquatica leii]|uniref:4-nitrophenylphosphatase n=1 Tax=Aquatica leii TaxID=1421715 RepID=A0AAN7SMK1_9COLE|nr:hypothetical protein RN001_003940 [Aquatica leii]